MSFEKTAKVSGTRRKARECALQMLFASDVLKMQDEGLTTDYWKELGDAGIDEKTQDFANNLVTGTLKELETIDDRIRTRAEHWRIERMAIVDRNVLRLAVYEFLFEDTPHTVVINEALEIARRFSTFEATQFINGILDAIKHDLEEKPAKSSQASTS
jgi:N utilization substance protein B